MEMNNLTRNSEYKDMEAWLIPREIEVDSSLSIYTAYAQDGTTLAYYEREHHPNDEPAKFVQATIVKKPKFYGKWIDKTKEYIALHSKPKTNSTYSTNSKKENRSATDDDLDLKLERAENLLRDLKKLQDLYGDFNNDEV